MASVSTYLSNSFERFNNGQSVSKSAIGGDLPTFSGRYARFMTMERGPQTDRIFKIAAVAILILAFAAMAVPTVHLGAYLVSKAILLSAPWGGLLAAITVVASVALFLKELSLTKRTFNDPLELEFDNNRLKDLLSKKTKTKFEDLPKMPMETVNFIADVVGKNVVDYVRSNAYSERDCFVPFTDQNSKKLGELPLGIFVGFDKFNQPVISLVRENDSKKIVTFCFRVTDKFHQFSWVRSTTEFSFKFERSGKALQKQSFSISVLRTSVTDALGNVLNWI